MTRSSFSKFLAQRANAAIEMALWDIKGKAHDVPVYALFGDVTAEDWSTDLDRGHAQSVDLVIWSEKGGSVWS